LPVRPILRYPDPRLKLRCDEVHDLDLARRVARDLLDTMDSCPPRTVGIAAPQIGEMHRIALVDTSRNAKYPPAHGHLALVNPEITSSSGHQRFREGCLSIPDFTANISRSMTVVVNAISPEGEPIQVTAEGFEAVVLQHEIDHLNGLLFLDRVTNLKEDLFRRKG
jgi:peptide deformylase